MNYAVILAGGAGTRFWPMSRKNLPKQFLNLCSDKPLIEQTIKRIGNLVSKKNIYVATNKIYSQRTKNCLENSGVPIQNLFLEPEARNTLAPILMASKKIYEEDKDAVILILPSDHCIKNERKFLSLLRSACYEADNGYIVTLGIKPDRADTGYGYIKVKGKNKKANIFKVEKFIEKPDAIKARKFIKDRGYYWNGGIFIFRADVLLDEAKKFLPSDYKVLNRIKSGLDISRLWPRFTFTSIDYGLMERTDKLALIPCDCGWSDLGSWKAVEEFAKKDKAGNIFRGGCIDIGSKNTLCSSESRIVATIGLRDIIIVDTKDALLVCSKEKTQEVKKIVQILKNRKLDKLV